MIEPEFEILGVTSRRFSAVPTLDFDVHVSEPTGRAVYTMALTAGITIRAQAWTQTTALVPAFTGATTFKLVVPCSYALEQAAPAYFHGAEGDAPLVFHFNGTVFYRGDDGGMQMELVPWSCSVDFSFPVAVWQAMMAHHYPDGAWVSLHTATLDSLLDEQRRRGAPTLDACVGELLEEARCSSG
jgi:hypothetical protein